MTDKIALITGASRGLGRAAALKLAETGTHVIGTYNRSKDAADEVAAGIEACGARAAMLPFDAETGDIPAFAAEIADTLRTRFGRDSLDHLVNNAGIGVHAPFAETAAEDLDRLYRIHVRTPFLLTRALLPLVAEGGHILFVSSGLARFALPGYAAYGAMKGAVEVLARYGAREFGARGIRVNSLAPGAIETDFGGGAVRDDAEVNAFVAANTALGRPGLPDDIGNAVAALLSGRLDWMTGQRVEVSGGQSL
ncbi:SDR family NAD(P)-dependent oxidoreductase [Roseivivax isoporae]|uniref:Short-chain dehydrogenase n=1 Tax=Roseivivax isoporae LMG 25204 TaxID=1449351 RepID=X7F392_9RHOB|nr:SDR family oxidoreductase [Roseivivax isoporae]ETX27218.1 hypothetical protein RISW2_14960 [Roseivivax isoporae LMG 25204]